MPNFTIKDPPEYNDEMRMLEPTDLGHARVFNPLFEKLLNNEVFLKLAADILAERIKGHIESVSSHVTAQDKENWNAKASTTAATQGAAGLMSAADKKKLDGVAEGAEANQSAFSNIKVGTVTIAANGKTSTFTLEAGDNITLTADNATKKINIKANRDGGNADTLDGYHAAHFAAADHGHDGRYYTQSAIDNLLKQKAAASHSHTKAGITDFAHTHDDRYYTETEVNNLLVGKAAAAHSHTKASITDFPTSMPPTAHTHSDYAAKSIYGDSAISLGRKAGTKVGGNNSIAVGYNVTASGYSSYAEGQNTTANEICTHAEGSMTTASGACAHAEGQGTIANAYYSHAGGRYNVKMNGPIGQVIHSSNDHIFVIGNGSNDTTRSNALSLLYNGIFKTASTITASTAADYAEFFEWQDGNPDAADRVGHFVTMDGDKVRIADADDTYILGIVSGRPFVLGNGDCDTWAGMYLHDEFNREIMEPAPKIELVEITEEIEKEVQEIDEETREIKTTIVKETIVTGYKEQEVLDENGNPVYEGTRPKLNPEYDHTQKYISRFDRPEWDAIGMLGVLAVYDDRSCQVNGFCKVAAGGIATAADGEYTLAEGKIVKNYRVIERVTDNIIKVIFR